MSNTLQSRIPQLQREMEIITANNWDPMFCVAKLSAVAADDVEGYCEALEEELAVKGDRLAELLRTDSLSAEIVERLRERIQADEEVIEQLRAERHGLIAEFKKVGVAAQAERDTARDTERLIANLEAENVRQTRRAEAAQERYQHAAAAAAEAQDLAHRLQQELDREKQRMKDMIAYMSTAQDEANTLRRATWAPLRAEAEA
jgi:chromosome segregation ATPase